MASTALTNTTNPQVTGPKRRAETAPRQLWARASRIHAQIQKCNHLGGDNRLDRVEQVVLVDVADGVSEPRERLVVAVAVCNNVFVES